MILDYFTQLTDMLGITNSSILSFFLYFFITAIVAMLSSLIIRKVVVVALDNFFAKTENKWDDYLIKNRVFLKLSFLAPTIVFYYSTAVFNLEPHISQFIIKLVWIAIIWIVLKSISAFLNTCNDIYKDTPKGNVIPLTSYIQAVKIILYFIAFILTLSVLFDQSPKTLLAGLGALTAVFMLVFKDTILGFVASFQFTALNTVKKGDWIEMPAYGADGDVIDISINTVKVQNWDKTISMIPTHTLVSSSFKNWTGMQNSGGRRIKRNLYIDMNTIKFCNEELINKFLEIEYLKDYTLEKGKEIETFNNSKADINTKDCLINGRRLTNIGCFREYIKGYLKNNSKIHKDMTFLVRLLEPTEKGLPIQIYVFTNDIVWANYEGIQSDIFDHLLAVVQEFELKVFQSPAGVDFQSLTKKGFRDELGGK